MKEELREIFFSLYNKYITDAELDKEWKDFGVDSLDYVEFIIHIEKHFNILIDEAAFSIKTPRQLIEYLKTVKNG